MKIEWRGFLMTFLFTLTNIVYLNILWIIFSLIGFGVLGVAPATVAVMKSLEGFRFDSDYVPIKTFFSYYKKAFKQANQLQTVYFLAIALLFLSYRVLVLMMGVTGIIPVFYLTIIVVLLFTNGLSLQSLLLYPDMTTMDRFKLSLFLIMRYPLMYVPIIFTLIGCYFIVTIKSAILIFIGAVLPIVVIAFLQTRMFSKFKRDFPSFGVIE